MVAHKRVVRRVSAGRRDQLNRLASLLYEFLPLNSPAKSTVTFRTIFAESGVEKYLEGPTNKTQALQKGFVSLYRYHDRLPKMVIRKVIPAAIEYRRHKRRPITREELNSLASCLEALEIDMTNEIAAIDLDESIPRIVVPPDELKERLHQHDLDPAISGEPLDLFDNGHFNEAVRKAAEMFEDRVRSVSGLDAHGRDLMAKAFANDALIAVSKIQPENRDDFVEGFKFLAMGMMAAIRNVFSHGAEEVRSPEECFEMLLLINWLYRSIRNKDETR